MARMCVATKRMDVALVCMGHMGNVAGVRALRDAEKEPQLEARVAALAIQLGMIQDAERLYRECGRFDLLNKLYQDSGHWDTALQLARDQDRSHLRNTHFHYARHLESLKMLKEAAEHYEASDTERYEIPRMLFDDPTALEEYVKQSQNKHLLKWWAQYLESSQDMDAALEFYAAAEDTLSLVRVNCYLGNMEKVCI